MTLELFNASGSLCSQKVKLVLAEKNLEWKSNLINLLTANINAKIEPMLDRLEKQLSQTHWLCGATYSLADAVWTAVLNRLDELNFSYLWLDSTCPALESYLNRLKSRPSFKIAIEEDEMSLSMLIAGLRRIFLGI